MAVLPALFAGCGTLPPAPGVTDGREALLRDIRAFERRIGFADTRNFVNVAHEQHEYSFCGYTSRFALPYSYEDPAIKWLLSVTEEACRARGDDDADVYWTVAEALGEVGTPVTRAMLTARVERFVYLVLHENCHDQFELPHGIEEALCEVISHRAMAMFSAERYGAFAQEGRAIREYAEVQSARTRATLRYYDQIALLYARYERRDIPPEMLLQERAAIFTSAQSELNWSARDLNNVAIANRMTYSRHYPLMESVFDALGRDPARMVEFFRHVDKIKPSSAQVMEWQRIGGERSVEFVRAYELAVVETIRAALAGAATVGKESR